jgi:hypothetical protein
VLKLRRGHATTLRVIERIEAFIAAQEAEGAR